MKATWHSGSSRSILVSQTLHCYSQGLFVYDEPGLFSCVSRITTRSCSLESECAFRAIKVNSRCALCCALRAWSQNKTLGKALPTWKEALHALHRLLPCRRLQRYIKIFRKKQTTSGCEPTFSIASRAIEAVMAPWNSSFTWTSKLSLICFCQEQHHQTHDELYTYEYIYT